MDEAVGVDNSGQEVPGVAPERNNSDSRTDDNKPAERKSKVRVLQYSRSDLLI